MKVKRVIVESDYNVSKSLSVGVVVLTLNKT